MLRAGVTLYRLRRAPLGSLNAALIFVMVDVLILCFRLFGWVFKLIFIRYKRETVGVGRYLHFTIALVVAVNIYLNTLCLYPPRKQKV